MSTIAQGRLSLSHTLCFMFSGKAGTGKTHSSEIAQKLCNNAGLSTFRAPLAKGVKDTARFMGWDGEKDRRGRILLQKIGAIGRDYDKDMWVRAAFCSIEESVGYPYDAVFIDDWRFTNELEFIQREQLLYKPVLIRLEAPDREILSGTPEYNDISETGLDNFPFSDSALLSNYDGYKGYFMELDRIVVDAIRKVSN